MIVLAFAAVFAVTFLAILFAVMVELSTDAITFVVFDYVIALLISVTIFASFLITCRMFGLLT